VQISAFPVSMDSWIKWINWNGMTMTRDVLGWIKFHSLNSLLQLPLPWRNPTPTFGLVKYKLKLKRIRSHFCFHLHQITNLRNVNSTHSSFVLFHFHYSPFSNLQFVCIWNSIWSDRLLTWLVIIKFHIPQLQLKLKLKLLIKAGWIILPSCGLPRHDHNNHGQQHTHFVCLLQPLLLSRLLQAPPTQKR
jgi:hypothetical protein